MRYLIAFVALWIGACADDPDAINLPEDLVEARAELTAEFIRKSPPPGSDKRFPAPDGVRTLRYDSGTYQFPAWLKAPDNRRGEGPAVLYVHPGTNLRPRHWRSVEELVDYGFVLMAPTLRGEGGNRGFFEGFRGEVDDVIAAAEMLGSLAVVDRDRIFLLGEGSGGTLAMLAAQSSDMFRVAACVNCDLTMGRTFTEWRLWPEKWASFDIKDKRERAIRTPMKFVRSLKVPVTIYADGKHRKAAQSFCYAADMVGRVCTVVGVSPGERNAMRWVVPLWAGQLNARPSR